MQMRSTGGHGRPAGCGGPAGARPACPRALANALAIVVLGLIPTSAWAADDPRDAAFLAPVIQQALETARTDVEVPWSNPATGHRGTIVVERTFYREPSMPCRDYMRTVETAGTAPQVTRGTGCRTGAGMWELDERPATIARSRPGISAPPTAGLPPAPGAGPVAPGAGPVAPAEREPPALAEAGPTCPDTVLVPLPSTRPPELAYTLPTRAAL
jgi:surface antigen